MATIKQQKAIKILVENGGKSASKAMLEAGYSEATAKTPSKLTGSQGFKDILENYLPDNLLLKKHNELLEAKVKTKITKKSGKQVVEEVIDTFAVKAALDMAYKIKGSYAPTRIKQTITTGLESKSDEELDEIIRENQPLLDRFEQYSLKE